MSTLRGADQDAIGGGQEAHSDRGIKRLLATPWVYQFFRRAMGSRGVGARLVGDYVRPVDGCRILDLGCGPGSLLELLPASIGEYFGLDANPAYIQKARAQWSNRPAFTFDCQDITAAAPPRRDYYDIVTAVAVIHHLDEIGAQRVFSLAHETLAPGGRLITWDGVYVAGQNRVAKWLISKDRGRAVRSADGYKALASSHFEQVECEILHDTLRLPYTICVMTCTKGPS